MPRKPDAGLEGHILDAAYQLWTRRGEGGLTMRAVAKAAGTTTPTVYERFQDKNGLLALLRQRALNHLVEVLKAPGTAAATCRRFLGFASSHPNEYRLLTSDWAAKLSRDEPKPTYEIIKGRLAAELGGDPEEHAHLALALGAIVHGTATMLMTKGVEEHVTHELRGACHEACKALIEIEKTKSRR